MPTTDVSGRPHLPTADLRPGARDQVVLDAAAQLASIDAALSAHWQETLAPLEDPQRADSLAEAVRHLRHARLALLRTHIG